MSGARGISIGLALLACASCQQKKPTPKKPLITLAAPSASQLDGMQLSAARRVSLETAAAAMRSHDLERLKQLSVWVRNRATVDILPPGELAALDLAIECLSQVMPPSDALSRLSKLDAGTLAKPVRTACAAHETGAAPGDAAR